MHKFGRGVYFAVNSRYSTVDKYSKPDDNNIKYMYYARVLVGNYTIGKEDMTACPPLNPNFPEMKYDSLCNNTDKPTIFVIFNDAQAYPEYLVKFKSVDKTTGLEEN